MTAKSFPSRWYSTLVQSNTGGCVHAAENIGESEDIYLTYCGQRNGAPFSPLPLDVNGGTVRKRYCRKCEEVLESMDCATIESVSPPEFLIDTTLYTPPSEVVADA
jgi:hypothetical protein